MISTSPLRHENLDPSVLEGIEAELKAFVAELEVRHHPNTVHSYRQGAKELLEFLARQSKPFPEMTARVFLSFRDEILNRGPRGEAERSEATRRLLLNGARRYLRSKARRGLLEDGALFFLVHPMKTRALEAAYIGNDPARAALFRDVDSFIAHLQASSYRGQSLRSYRNGALALRFFLARRGKPPSAIAAEDWKSFREETLERGPRGTGELSESTAFLLLTGARAYLRYEAERGALRPEQLPAAPRAPKPAPNLPPVLSSLAERLEEMMALAQLSPHTRHGYRQALRDFLLYLTEKEGIESLVDVTREVVTAYRLYRQTEPTGKGTPPSLSTQRAALTGLRFFFGSLVKTGALLTDPTTQLPHGRSAQTLPRSVKSSEVRRLLTSLPPTAMGMRDRAVLELLYGTGMRRAELVRLRLDDVDLERSTILIREGKGRKDRVVPLGKKAKEALLNYLDLSRGKLLRGESRALFVGNGGRALSLNYLTERVKTLGERVGVKVTPHLLRHSCATDLLKGRADIRHIQRLLGHESLHTTERYTRVEVSDLRKVIERCHPREKQ